MTRDMTIREIAELCNVDRTTALRWAQRVDGALCTEIGAKCTEADKSKVAARFTLDETLAIIRAGGKATLANLLAENARKAMATTPKLPNGTQLVALERMVEKKTISPYQAQLLLGVAAPRENPLPEVPATAEEGTRGFAAIRSRFALPAPAQAKATRAACAAYDATAARLANEAHRDSLQGRLM